MEEQAEEWTDLGAELGQLVGLSVEPAEGLHVLQGGAGSGTGGRGAQSNGCIILRQYLIPDLHSSNFYTLPSCYPGHAISKTVS